MIDRLEFGENQYSNKENTYSLLYHTSEVASASKIMGMAFNNNSNGLSVLTMYLFDGGDWCCVKSGGSYYVASTEETVSQERIDQAIEILIK